MPSRISPLLAQRIVQLVATALLPCMIAAAVLANQPVGEMQFLGRICHFVSIASAVTLLMAAIGAWSLPYVALVCALFAAGVVTSQRLPYEVSLNVMFLAAGIYAAWISRENMTKALLALTLLSGFIMLLQVLGAGDWTQALTTHGILAGGGKVLVPLEPTFLVSAAEFQGSYLQGRPSGIFHSNQFASLVVLITFALTVTAPRPVSIALGFALCVVATLLLSKVVLLGIGCMILALFLTGERRTGATYLVMMGAALALYAAAFPGLLELFLVNPHVMVVSMVVRLIDVAVALGFDASAAMRWLQGTGLIEAGQMNDALVGRIVTDNAIDGRSTAFVTLSLYTPVFFSAAAALLLSWLSMPSVRLAVATLRSAITRRNILILVALSVFSLAADFLAAGIFWAFVGLAVPLLGFYSQRETDFNTVATATSAQAAA